MKISDLFPVQDIRPTNRAGKEAPARQGAGRDLDLATGQLLKGRVSGFTPEGKVLLEIGGQTVTARSTVNLTVGSEFWFEVKQTGNEPWLALAGKKGAAREFLQQILGDSPALGRAFSRLFGPDPGLGDLPPEVREFSSSLAASSIGSDPRPEQLVRLLLWLGGKGGDSQRLGAQLGDLVLALQKKAAQDGIEPAHPASLDRLAGIFEAMHQVNSQVPQEHQPLFWLFPCFFATGEGWGSWLLNLSSEQQADREPRYTLSFFLEMSRLGEVQLQVGVQGKSLCGTFAVADVARGHMEKQLPELKERLAALGYGPVSLSCRAAEQGLLQGLKGAVEKAARLDPVRILDVKA